MGYLDIVIQTRLLQKLDEFGWILTHDVQHQLFLILISLMRIASSSGTTPFAVRSSSKVIFRKSSLQNQVVQFGVSGRRAPSFCHSAACQQRDNTQTGTNIAIDTICGGAAR
jgi:hypothetical protein